MQQLTFLLSATACLHSHVEGFATSYQLQHVKTGFSRPSVRPPTPMKSLEFESSTYNTQPLTIAKAKSTDKEVVIEEQPLTINPPYLAAYALFLSYAVFRSTTEPDGASMEVLQKFFADPLNPGVNEAFVTVFNLLGLYFLPMAMLLMPGAKNQKFPAT